MTRNDRIGEDQNGSGRFRGRRSLWASERSYSMSLHVFSPIPPKKVCQTPSTIISHPPPQEPKGVVPKAFNPVTEDVKQALEAVSPAVPEAPEAAILASMTPLHLQLGGIKRVYKCQVEGCSEGSSTSHATICAHVCIDHLGVGLACPSCDKTFFNPDTIRCHRKSHVSQ